MATLDSLYKQGLLNKDLDLKIFGEALDREDAYTILYQFLSDSKIGINPLSSYMSGVTEILESALEIILSILEFNTFFVHEERYIFWDKREDYRIFFWDKRVNTTPDFTAKYSYKKLDEFIHRLGLLIGSQEMDIGYANDIPYEAMTGLSILSQGKEKDVDELWNHLKYGQITTHDLSMCINELNNANLYSIGDNLVIIYRLYEKEFIDVYADNRVIISLLYNPYERWEYKEIKYLS